MQFVSVGKTANAADQSMSTGKLVIELFIEMIVGRLCGGGCSSTARDKGDAENLFDLFMAHPSQIKESSQNTGRFTIYLFTSWWCPLYGDESAH